MSSLDDRLRRLATALNEPEIALESLQRWLRGFSPADRPVALLLLECMEYHGYGRLIHECRRLHEHLCRDLAEDGFDVESWSDVDFTRAFTCKSGDIISVFYRKANRIPVTRFHNIEALLEDRSQPSTGGRSRALVILDDYIGTGSQFLFQFLARNPRHIALLKTYRKVRLGAIVVHDDARVKLRLLKQKAIEEVVAIEEQELTCVDLSGERMDLCHHLASVDWRNFGLLAVQRDFPLLQRPELDGEQRREIRRLLGVGEPEESSGTTEFLLGHHTFFYGAPNALPRLLLPVFRRIEDFTVYPREIQVGLPSDLIDYDMDNPQPITHLYPR